MAFPVVSGTASGNQASDTTSHTFNLPASIASGDLLLAFAGFDGNPGLTFPASWVQLFIAGGTFMHTGYYKIADGTEGATITVTTTASEQSAHVVYRVTSWHGTTAPEAPAAASSSSATPNPPSFTPSWGAADTLWFAGATPANSDRTFSADPASYVSGTTQATATGTAGAIIRVVRREANTATEDPGTFTIDASSTWDASTVAVRPAGAAGGATGAGLLLLGVG